MISLGLRLAWGFLQPAEIDERLPDQREYIELARNLLAGEGLRFNDPRFAQDVHAYRMPGYPAFLAACGGSVRIVRAVQAVLDASTVLAVFLLARRWLTPGATLVAAAFVAFNPFLVYFSGLILSETLSTAMLAWGMVLLAWRRNYLWGGLILALSILVRPSGIALPVVLGIGAVFVHDRPVEPGRRGLPVGATMVLLTVLALFPWALRNRALLGEWIWLTTNGGITRYDGFNPDARGDSDQKFIMSREMAFVRDMSELQRNRYLSERADQYIADTWAKEPRRLLHLTLAKIGRTWSPVPLSEDFGRRPSHFAAALAYSIPFDLLIVLGVWAGKLPRPVKLFLLLPALYFTAVHALSVGSLRYRVPVEPPLAVLAAAGAVVLAALCRRPQWRREPTQSRPVADSH